MYRRKILDNKTTRETISNTFPVASFSGFKSPGKKQYGIGQNPFSYESFVNKGKSIARVIKLSVEGKAFTQKDSRDAVLKKLRLGRSKSLAIHYKKLALFAKLIYKTNISQQEIMFFINIFERRVVDHGFNHAIKLFKSLAGFAQRYAAEQVMENLPRFSADEGFPKVLKPFKKHLDGKYSRRTAVLLIVELPKHYGFGDVIPASSTIVDAGVLPLDDFSNKDNIYPGRYFNRLSKVNNDPFVKILSKRWKKTLTTTFQTYKVKRRFADLIKAVEINISPKNGPNEVNLVGAPMDFISMLGTRDNSGTTLIEVVRNLAVLTKHKELIDIIDLYNDVYCHQPVLHGYDDESSFKTGKISVKQELFGKSRLIAIIDFFTQSVLKAVHKEQFVWLKKQTEDGTHNQDRLSESVRKLSLVEGSKENSLFSLDLTAATDRLPIDLQMEIVGQQFGKDVASLWYILCRERPFAFLDSEIRYAVGQPMGTYSSWSNLAICNHMMAKTSSLILNKKYSKESPNYFIIGDDFVCKGYKLSWYYKRILTLIGVKISESKGFTPMTHRRFNGSITDEHFASLPNVVELAKRVFINGVELTPIRTTELFTSLGEPILFKSLIKKVFERVRILDSYEITALAKLTYKPKKAIGYLLSLYNPSVYLKLLICKLESYKDLSYIHLANGLDIDGKPFANKRNLVATSLTELSYYTGSFKDLENKILNLFSMKIYQRFKKSLVSFSKFFNKTSFSEYDERLKRSSLPDEHLGGFLFMFDYLLLHVYKRACQVYSDALDVLNQGDETGEYVVKVCTLLTSIHDYDLLIEGKRDNPSSKKDGSIQSVMDDIEGFINNSLTVGDKLDLTKTIRYDDVKDMFDFQIDHNEIVEESFNRFVPKNDIQKLFLESKEGYFSLLENSVQDLLTDLSYNTDTKRIVTGTSLLRKGISLDPDLSKILIEDSVHSILRTNGKIFDSVLLKLKNSNVSEKTLEILSRFSLDNDQES